MKIALVSTVALLLCATASAWEQKEQDAALQEISEMGMPQLAAFRQMSPKMLLSITKNYLALMAPDAFEYVDAFDIEVIFAAVSAANNCEICASFHAMVLSNPEAPSSLAAEDVAEILSGGLPADPKARSLVIATKYALAHKGVLLEREKAHLATLGFDSEDKMLEIIYCAGVMNSLNMVYIHMISNGVHVEDFLKQVGPFKDSVYAGLDAEL